MNILNEFREAPLPPSRVDVPAALAAGRRRQRARRGAMALSAAAVLAAAAAATPQVLRLASSGGGGTGQPAATTPISCAVPGPVEDEPPRTAPGEAPTQFDPLRRWVDASDVAGYRVESYATAPAWQRLELKTPSGDGTVEVTLYAEDRTPIFPSKPGTPPAPVDPTTGISAGRVGSAQAWWLPGRQGLAQFEVARLGWRWAPRAWAFVAAADTSDYGQSTETAKTPQEIDHLRAVALAAARELRIGAGDAVRSPFAMPVPDCTHLISTILYESTTTGGEPFTRLTLTFGVPGSEEADPLGQRGDGQTVSVTSDSAATPESKPGSATAEVDGHPAYSDGDFLVVYGVGGFAFELRCPGGEDAVRELFRSIYVRPGTTDARGTWTDTPLER